MRFYLVLTILLLFVTSSCTSFHTTALSRLDSDSLFVDCMGRKQKGKGIPVKMKVPSHVTVTVYEQQILIRGKEGVKLQSFSPPQYEVKTGLAYTDKVFLVDFVRPAGGSLNLINSDPKKDGLAFDDEQYFKAIQADVTDQTMKQIAGALDEIAKIPGSLAKKPAASGNVVSANIVSPSSGLPNVHFENSIVAYQRFDLARPHWEEEMNCFVEQYLGHCGSYPESVHSKKMTAMQNKYTNQFSPVIPPSLEKLEE